MLLHHIVFGAFYFIGVSGKFWSGKKFGPGSVKTEYRVVHGVETSIAYIMWYVPRHDEMFSSRNLY